MKMYSIFEDTFDIYLIRFVGFTSIDGIDYIHYNIILNRADYIDKDSKYIVGLWNDHIKSIRDGDESYDYKELYSYDMTNSPGYLKYEFYIPKKFNDTLRNKFWNVSLDIPENLNKNDILEILKSY
jgi:hypothetical protein